MNRNRKPPMTESEAIENVAAMRKGTRPDAMRRLLEYAVGGFGNLSPAARSVYLQGLRRPNGKS